MYLRNRLFIASLVVLFNMLAAQAQTLYWVGGSGNFNDPMHWSTIPGGVSDGKSLPDQNTKVVFKNQYRDDWTVQFPQVATVADLEIDTRESVNFKKSALGSTLTLTGSLTDRITNVHLNSNIDWVFTSNSQQVHSISSGSYRLNGNVTVIGGKWNINSIALGNNNSLVIKTAELFCQNAFLRAGRISIFGAKQSRFEQSQLVVTESFKVEKVRRFLLLKPPSMVSCSLKVSFHLISRTQPVLNFQIRKSIR